MNTTDIEGLRKQLAAIEHERWSDWQAWMHSILRRSGELTEGADEILSRWDKQIRTPYAELSAKEQDSDMEQVDRYWPLIEKYTEQVAREAQLSILRGFRRRDFQRDDFYEGAVIERIDELSAPTIKGEG